MPNNFTVQTKADFSPLTNLVENRRQDKREDEKFQATFEQQAARDATNARNVESGIRRDDLLNESTQAQIEALKGNRAIQDWEYGVIRLMGQLERENNADGVARSVMGLQEKFKGSELFEPVINQMISDLEAGNLDGIAEEAITSVNALRASGLSQMGQGEAPKRERAKDQNDVLRFIDNGEPVFPEVVKVDEELSDKDQFDRAETIRTEISKVNADFLKIANSWDRISTSANDPTGAGDMALIFNFMKMLDPGSTVREGEFANAQNTGGAASRLISNYNQVVNGQKLSQEQRADFLSQAESLFNTSKDRAENIENEYAAMADRYGVPREDVLIDRGAPPGTIIADGENGEILWLIDGEWVEQ